MSLLTCTDPHCACSGYCRCMDAAPDAKEPTCEECAQSPTPLCPGLMWLPNDQVGICVRQGGSIHP